MIAKKRVRRCIPRGSLAGVDTETTGISPWHGDQPYAVSICTSEGRKGYFEWWVDPFTRKVRYNRAEVIKLVAWLENPNMTFVWFNGKFDRRMLDAMAKAVLGRPIRWCKDKQEEVQFAAHVCNSMEPRYALKPLAQKYIGIDVTDLDLLKKAAERARRIGKRQGYKLGVNLSNGKAAIEADYWMVRYCCPEDWHLVKTYAVTDAVRTMLLWLMYVSVLDEMEDAGWPIYRHEMQLEPIVEGMEAAGLYYDREKNNQLLQECYTEKARSLEELKQFSGMPDFDPKKPKHVSRLLYEIGDSKGTLPIGLMTKGGKKEPPKPSTAYKYVQLFKDRPMVQALFRHKTAQKGISTYFRVFDVLAVPDAQGRGLCCHSSFRQLGPRTGRFSSGGAGNWQNIPDGISTRAGKTVRGRDITGPRPGYRWYLADYSQLEVRIFADVSQEPFLLEALAGGHDIHTEAANKAWGNEKGIIDSRATLGLSGTLVNAVNYHEYKDLHKEHARMGLKERHLFGRLSVDDQEKIARQWLESYHWDIVAAEGVCGMKHARAKAKILLFCRMFGGGPKAIKDLLYVTEAEARRFLDDYAVAFPRMTAFINEVTRQARLDGFVLTEDGRRLMVPPDKPYKGVNYRVQGSAARLLKRAMLKVGEHFAGCGKDARLLLTIHDELVSEVKREQCTKGLVRTIKQLMEDHEGMFSIPMPVEVSFTDERWPDKKKVQWLADEHLAETRADKRENRRILKVLKRSVA